MKVYWAVRSSTIVVAVMDSSGKLVMESILETKAAHPSVLCRLRRNLGGDLRRRNLVGLAVRSAGLPGGQTGGVQSAQERVAQRWEQERSHRWAQAGRTYVATNSNRSTTARPATIDLRRDLKHRSEGVVVITAPTGIGPIEISGRVKGEARIGLGSGMVVERVHQGVSPSTLRVR